MVVTNAQLKTLLNLHSFLPNDEEFKNVSPDYKQVIIKYERILCNLLEQKMLENEQTRLYLEEKRVKHE